MPRAALPEELSFSADGAVWLVRRDGTPRRLVDHIYKTMPDGSLRSLRTIHGVEWSPDGSTLLAWTRTTAPWLSLVLVGADGQLGPKIATGAFAGHWSPDGTRIAFVRRTPGAGYALFVVSNDGTSMRRIASLGQPGAGSFSWSPDSSQLVYAGRRDSGLFIADATGHDAPQPIRAPGRDLEPGAGVAEAHWSPDGSLIAFRRGGQVYVVRPDGTGSRVLADGSFYGLTWSPDSQSLAFAGPLGPGTFGNVWVVRRDGSGLHRVARCSCTLRGPGFSPSIAWSSNGTRLTYVGGRGNVVSTVRPDGAEATRVAIQAPRGLSGGWYPWWPIWRPAHGR